mmetsp:Transcript_17034/g.30074  ORF Transcript_17034/g.30074 Transcript_17034/m.30074 type:complete len:129 (-) Transcript_17034:735-1121(-)
MPLRRSSILVAVFGMPKEGHLCLTRYKGSNCSTATVHLVNTKVTQLISNLSPTNATGNTGVALPRIIATEAHAKDLSPGRSSNLDPISSDCGTPPPEQVPLPIPAPANRHGSAWPVPRIRLPPRMKNS